MEDGRQRREPRGPQRVLAVPEVPGRQRSDHGVEQGERGQRQDTLRGAQGAERRRLQPPHADRDRQPRQRGQAEQGGTFNILPEQGDRRTIKTGNEVQILQADRIVQHGQFQRGRVIDQPLKRRGEQEGKTRAARERGEQAGHDQSRQRIAQHEPAEIGFACHPEHATVEPPREQREHQRVGQRKEARPAQVALAWLLARKPWIVPIPGTTKMNHLEEDLGALKVELTEADVKEIEDGLAKIQVQGARTTEQLLAQIDVGAKLGTSSAGGHGLSPLPRKPTQ